MTVIIILGIVAVLSSALLFTSIFIRHVIKTMQEIEEHEQ